MRHSFWSLVALKMRGFLYKHNGLIASLCALVFIMGASVHAMHSRFEQASACQTQQNNIQQHCKTQRANKAIDVLGVLFSSRPTP